MNSEHNAYYGLEYLLAGCTMSNEERMAVREVTRCSRKSLEYTISPI